MSSSVCGYVTLKYGRIPPCEMGLSQYYFKKRLGALPVPINLSKQCWSHLKEQLSVKYFFEFEPDFALFFSMESVELGKYVIESCSYNVGFDQSALS